MEKKFYSLPNVSLRDKIPVPPRKPLPLDDVPMWFQLPYDTKYPLSDCSKTAITLTTEELGKSNYRKHHPAIKQWLSDKTKHYKRLMEIKLNAGRNRDKKLRSRREKIYESSRTRLERDMKLRELEREKQRALTEQRYDKVKRLWGENERALKERKKKKTTDLPRSFTYTDSLLHKWITSDSESSPSYKISEPDMLHTDLDDDQVAKSTFSEKYNTEKVHVTFPEISKTDKVKKEFDDSMEITNTSLQQKDDDKFLEISDRKLTCKVPLKEEKNLQQIVDMYTKETEEDTRKEEVLKKGNYLKKRDEELTLPVQSKGLDYKDDTDSTSIQKLKPQLGLVEQSQLIKFLYGLPDVTKSNKSESDDYSLLTEKADEIPGKTNAKNPEATEELEDSTSHSFKASLKENSVRSKLVVKREKLEDSMSHSFKTALKENSTKSEPVIKKRDEIPDKTNARNPEATEKLEDSTSHSFNTPLKEDSARSESVIKKEKLEDSTSHSFKTSLKKNSVRSEPVVKREKLENSISHSFKTPLKENPTKSEPVLKKTDEIPDNTNARNPEATEKLEDSTSHSFNTPLKEDSARSEPVIKKEKLEDSTSHSLKTSLKENSVRSEPVVKREKLEDSISHSFKTPLKKYSTKSEPVIKKTDEILDKNSANSPEVTKKPEDSKSYSFKTPLEEILQGYGYEEHDDVWKALDNLYEERKRKFRGIVGLDELKIKQWRNEKIQKELCESTPFSIQHKKSATLEKYPAAHTLDEITLKKYKTGSESKLSDDKSILKRIFAKQTFDDIFIKNEHKNRNVQKLQKMKLAKNISKTVLNPKPEIEQKVKIDYSRSDIFKAKKNRLDADLLILRRKAHFTGKGISKEKVTDLYTPHTTVIKLQKENTSPDLNYMQSKRPQTHQFINKTTSCGKEDSERVEKYLATLVDDIILEAEVPTIMEKKTAADGMHKIASKLDHKLLSNIKSTQSIKDNTQKTELKFDEKDVATPDSNNFAKSCSAITDSLNFRCDDIKCGIIEPKDENIEKDSIEEFGPSFITGDSDKKITAEDASICRKLTITDRSNNIKYLQTKQEISEIDSILQKSANRNKESLTDNIQEMTDTYINLQISTPNETMNILDNKDLLHSSKNEDVYESVNQKVIYNYLSAKAPEYFGYLDDTFDDVLKKKQAETFSKSVMTGEKHLILPSDTQSVDITDVNENSVSFQPINIVIDIERRGPEAKYTSTLDSHHGIKTNNEQKHELTITKPINKEITHNNSNNFLLDANYKTHLQSAASEKLDEKYTFLEQAKGKDHQMKYFQQTEAETTAQTQPKQKEKENAKLPDFDIQQNIASLDAVPSAFTNNNDLTRDVDETLSDHHFHRIKFSKNSPSSDIDGNNAISIQNEEETKSAKDEVPKTETPVKKDLEDISDTKATTSEIKDEESMLPISDNPKMGAETEVSICSNYESENQINMHRIQPPPFDSRCSLVTPKPYKKYFEEYSEQADLPPDRTVDHTDESLPGTQTVPYNKDINQNLNRQFSKEEENLENDVTDNSITLNFEIPKSIIDDTNLDEKTLKLFLNKCISNITQQFRKKKYSNLTQIEPIADADENDSKDTSEILKKESNVLASIYRTIRNETLSKNANEEIHRDDSDADHNPSESKTFLSQNNIEHAKIFSEYSIDDEYLDVTGLTEDGNQSTDSSENNGYQNFNSNGNQDDALETEAGKLFFNAQFDSSKPNVKDYKACPSKYVYAQQNKEIMSIASEKVENIEQYFKISKIITTFTNVDEIIIADDTEDEIKIIEEKMSKLNL